MARAFVAASSHFIHWGDAWAEENVDWSASIWARPVADTTGYAMGKWVASTGWFARASGVTPTTLSVGINVTTDASTVLDAPNFFANNTWVHLGILFHDDGADNVCDMDVYKNGTSVATNFGMDRVDANATDFGIGNRSDLTRDWNGDLAEPAFWLGTLLTPAHMRMLGQGYRPDQIGVRPTFYAPCLTNTVDLMGGLAGTDNGTTKADHPFIRPARRHWTFWSKGVTAPPPPTVVPAFAGTRRIHRLAPVRWG